MKHNVVMFGSNSERNKKIFTIMNRKIFWVINISVSMYEKLIFIIKIRPSIFSKAEKLRLFHALLMLLYMM